MRTHLTPTVLTDAETAFATKKKKIVLSHVVALTLHGIEFARCTQLDLKSQHKKNVFAQSVNREYAFV